MNVGDSQVIVFGDPEALDPGNIDVEVIEPDGSRWSATFFTLANVEALFQKNANTGECARGLYLWAADMILVRQLSESVIRETITELKATGEFETAFGRLHPDAGD